MVRWVFCFRDVSHGLAFSFPPTHTLFISPHFFPLFFSPFSSEQGSLAHDSIALVARAFVVSTAPPPGYGQFISSPSIHPSFARRSGQSRHFLHTHAKYNHNVARAPHLYWVRQEGSAHAIRPRFTMVSPLPPIWDSRVLSGHHLAAHPHFWSFLGRFSRQSESHPDIKLLLFRDEWSAK